MVVHDGIRHVTRRHPGSIRRMVDPVLHRHVGNGKGIDSLQAADVVSVLLRVGPAPMMGVDATGAAEVVPGRVGVELVEPEMLRTSHDAKPGQRYRRDDRALATTEGEVAAPGQIGRAACRERVWQYV